MSDPVEKLCRQAQAGDAAAASELLTLHYQPIFAWFHRLCGNEADAADLTQKTFAKAWTALPTFAGRSRFSTWLHGIGHHLYVDWRRQRRPTEARPDDWWEACAAQGPSPLDEVADRDHARRLYAAVEMLEEPTRQLVHLHYYQGLSLQETAEVLGVATSTVKYRLRAALDSLRAHTAEPRR
jgi:RNA polymerase sigma factor (sigma-70 family)